MLSCEGWAGAWQSACGHAACEDCIRQWIEAQIPQCRRKRHLRMRCFACSKTMPQQLVLHVSASARDLADRLEQRFELERNSFYPEPLQVECPRPDCVGLGYLEFATVMCFLCEHQWDCDPEQMAKLRVCYHSADGTLRLRNELPDSIQRCPRCGILIEKVGGCDHITCRCGYDFVWQTLEPWIPL